MHNNGRFVIARLGSTQILSFLYPAAKLTAHLGFVRVSELHSSVIVQLSRIAFLLSGLPCALSRN